MKRFNLQALETLCSIARLGTFNAAAQHLNATQPAISARIKELESAARVPLFSKQGRRMVLTIQGRKLVQMAEPLLQSLDDALVALGGLDTATGVVRMGVGEIAALSWLPDMMKQAKAVMPNVSYEIEVDITVHMRHRLESGDIDLAIVAAPLVLNEIKAVPLGTVDMVWVIAPGLIDQLPQLRPAVSDILHAYPIWSLPKSSAIYPIALNILRQFDIPAQALHTYDNLQGIIKLVLNQSGASLLPRILIQDYLDSGSLTTLSPAMPEPELEFAIAWNAGREQPVLKKIIDIAAECSTFKR